MVKEDDVIAQLETDKVTIDVKYTGKQPGVITSLQIKPQDVVQVKSLMHFVHWHAHTDCNGLSDLNLYRSASLSQQ